MPQRSDREGRTFERAFRGALMVGLALFGACQSPDSVRTPETVSLQGDELYAPTIDPDTHIRRLEQLEAAQKAAAAAPDDVDAAIWVGRRFGYLGRFREAIEVYSKALVKHPDSPQLLRHRGHRYLTLRRFHDAVNDLERAQRLVVGKPDVPEPDGLPNAANIPLSTLQSNIRYHLGVASYMLGDYARAADVLRESLESATNDDRWCSEGYWLYLTLRRLGRKADADLLLAPVSKDMQILENFSYQKLLLFFRGEGKAEALLAAARKDPDASAFPTIAYGIAMSRQFAGDAAGARELLEQITSGDNWPSFGYIGAEVDLARAAGRPVR